MSVVWQALQGEFIVNVVTRWRFVDIGSRAGKGGTTSGGGGIVTHRMSFAISTPRTMIEGVCSSALEARKPAWVKRPARCVGSRLTFTNGSGWPAAGLGLASP